MGGNIIKLVCRMEGVSREVQGRVRRGRGWRRQAHLLAHRLGYPLGLAMIDYTRDEQLEDRRHFKVAPVLCVTLWWLRWWWEWWGN